MKKTLFFYCMAAFLLLISCMNVRAAENPYSADDSRLNVMEERLADLGTSVLDIQNRLSGTEAELDSLNEFRLAISDQLDVIIVGLASLTDDLRLWKESELEYRNQLVGTYDELLLRMDRLEKQTDLLLNDTGDLLVETVSGNTIAAETNDILNEKFGLSNEELLTEVNTTLSATNTYLLYLFCFMLLFLVVAVFYFLIRYLWKILISHILRR